jgi:uncharacterized cupredoxin-like copper-binding protein
MSAVERNSLVKTIVAVLIMLVLVASALIVDLARRPAGALNVPKGYAVAHVTLTDYAIQAPVSLPKGDYEFVLTNRGSVPHELVMWATKAPASALPLRKDGSVDEESDQLDGVLDSGSSLAPGETRILFADLTEAGHYALVCNLPMHYRLGMHQDLAVH